MTIITVPEDRLGLWGGTFVVCRASVCRNETLRAILAPRAYFVAVRSIDRSPDSNETKPRYPTASNPVVAVTLCLEMMINEPVFGLTPSVLEGGI